MTQQRKRSPSSVLKRGYSDEEISHIYELARLFLENGEPQKGEAILKGIVEIAPEFVPGWLGLAYVALIKRQPDAAITRCQQALEKEESSIVAMLYLVSAYLTRGDIHSAGTYLGEVAEFIDAGDCESPTLVRFYRAQLARYQTSLS